MLCSAVWAFTSVDEAFEFLDGRIDIDPLALEVVDLSLAALDCLEALGAAAVANVVEVEQFLDVCQAKSDPLAPQDPGQPCTVALGIKPLGAAPLGRDQRFILIESQGASRNGKFVAQLANRIVGLVLKHVAFATLRFRKGQPLMSQT